MPVLVVIILLLVVGGVYVYKKRASTAVDTTNTTGTTDTSDINPQLLKAGTSVLVALRDADYQKLEELTSSAGLSWNEVPNLDLKKSDVAKADVSNIPTDKTEHLFGYTDGEGAPIMLTNAAYAKKYIYTHDYFSAPEIKVNEVVGTGNSINSVIKDAGDRLVIAYHFDGFDAKYEGMDWTTLYLIFDIEKGEYKLRGIAKDNWTI